MSRTGNAAPHDLAAQSVSPSPNPSVGYSQAKNKNSLHGNTPNGACLSCRQSKARCSPSYPGFPCVRCQKTARLCIPAERTERHQKQPGSRIVDIESRIDALATSIMQSQSPGYSLDLDPRKQGHTESYGSGLSNSTHIENTSKSGHAGSTNSHSSHTSMQQPHDGHDARTRKSPPARNLDEWENESIPQSYIDARISQNIDETTASTIFNRYVTAMAPNLPFVVFPKGSRATTIRKSKPVVFLAILDVASAGFCEVAAQRNIRRLIVQVYLHYMLRTDEYSLPLLQALIISATWYRPIEPTQPGEQMDVYQLSHTASNMAIIMGLDKKWGSGLSSESTILLPSQQQTSEEPLSSDAEERILAARRVWLGCHYICSNTSMALHSPNVMRWTRYMDECLDALESSPLSFPSDKLFCQHVKLQHIIEEFELQLAWESSAPVVNSTRESRVRSIHKAFLHQLEDWSKAVPQDCWNDILNFSMHFANLYINEVAMSSTSRRVHSSNDQQPSQKVAINASAFSTCVDSVNNLLCIIQSLDMSVIRAMPTAYFIRSIYTVIVLVKLHFAAMEQQQQQTDDRKLRAVSDLRVSERLEALIQMFAGWGELWPAARLTMIFKRLKTWFEEHGSSRMTLHELSWLSPWAFGKEGNDKSSPENQHQHPVIETPKESDTLSPPSSSSSSLRYGQMQTQTPCTQQASPPKSSSSNAANPIPPILPDFSSDPLISMDLDLGQIFPDAVQDFDLSFDLGNNASTLPGGVDIESLTVDEPPNMNLSATEWSAMFEDVSPPFINVDVDVNVGDAMGGLEYDDVE
ncbi:hypothetical protein EMCG_09386 [[Emmonsia] crescens]|uniref:Zn(2)-C6 fungal-type domain-containing protein n=1 Tax=[Emmonsia] crescens TaxID=73230 RepID=A0A0G2J357_9EURO|nr:hypothetical protein EMCG_09386 [Emmonsia crescens UAMH 3008]